MGADKDRSQSSDWDLLCAVSNGDQAALLPLILRFSITYVYINKLLISVCDS